MQSSETVASAKRLGFLLMTPPQRWNKTKSDTEAQLTRQDELPMGGGAAFVGEVPTPMPDRLVFRMPLYQRTILEAQREAKYRES